MSPFGFGQVTSSLHCTRTTQDSFLESRPKAPKSLFRDHWGVIELHRALAAFGWEPYACRWKPIAHSSHKLLVSWPSWSLMEALHLTQYSSMQILVTWLIIVFGWAHLLCKDTEAFLLSASSLDAELQGRPFWEGRRSACIIIAMLRRSGHW